MLYIEMGGTGLPVTATAAKDRKGKSGDEPAHTRKVKIGCVFTQTTADKEGRPVRDESSTDFRQKLFVGSGVIEPLVAPLSPSA